MEMLGDGCKGASDQLPGRGRPAVSKRGITCPLGLVGRARCRCGILECLRLKRAMKAIRDVRELLMHAQGPSRTKDACAHIANAFRGRASTSAVYLSSSSPMIRAETTGFDLQSNVTVGSELLCLAHTARERTTNDNSRYRDLRSMSRSRSSCWALLQTETSEKMGLGADE